MIDPNELVGGEWADKRAFSTAQRNVAATPI